MELTVKGVIKPMVIFSFFFFFLLVACDEKFPSAKGHLRQTQMVDKLTFLNVSWVQK